MGSGGHVGHRTRAAGRGPDYTRRRMPTTVPVVRRDLAASGNVTDWKLKREYIQVAPGLVIPTPEGYDSSAHGGFGVDCVTRAWAHHLVRPDAVLAGWAAAGVYGLRPDWCDSAPVLLLHGGTSRGSTRSMKAACHPVRPVIRPLPAGLKTMRPSRRFPQLKVVTPQVAAAHCLWTIMTGRHTWWVHDVPGMTREEVRAVQFLDAFCQCTWVTRAQILEETKGKVDRRVMERLLALADDGAQSPMETVLRLIVRDLLPQPFRWQSQIRVDLMPGAATGWTPRTLPDLGCEELKLALYYDGGHHDTASQTDVDFDQFHALRDLDWEALRFNKESIRSPAMVRERVVKARDRALRRMASLDAAAPAPHSATTM
ncbi:hypothetical protein CGLY_13725 [Corynebacterium glyciniphilum AJ 3170]|uniref:DUF559 domain-containing protein n=2 Tax=Corynebacterium TaxID=1716 RepID=X5ECS1_9CORY|nr:hypothetical protein CGLY_13725 [Corynebacterium glyciniphilum AJ 3170]